MTKVRKNCMLDFEIFEDIKKKKNEYSFNFSEWVNKKYYEEFLGIDNKQKKIQEHEQSILKLKKEVKIIKKREQTYAEILSRTEKRFLSQVPRLIKEGKEWSPLSERFNITFNRKFTESEFRKMVEVIDAQKKSK